MKKLIALLLTVALMATLCVPTIAADCKAKKEYKVYTCVGDSAAAGVGQPKDGMENKFDYTGNDFAGYVAKLTGKDSTLVYRGYKPEVVPTAYPALVANALGAEVNICARSAMRALELRYMLTGVFNDPDPSHAYTSKYYDEDDNGFTMSDLDKINNLYQFRDKIEEADIITIGLGSNDVITPTVSVLATLMGAGTVDPGISATQEKLGATGIMGAALGKLVEILHTAEKYTALIKNLFDVFYENFVPFKENFEAVIDEIYKINPDATVLCVGVYNPFNNTMISANSSLKLDIAAAPFVNMLNTYFRSLSLKYGSSLIYVDVTDTPLYDAVLDDPTYMSYVSMKSHPTIAGYQYVAGKILDRIPGYSTKADCCKAAGTICTAILAAHVIHMMIQK